MKSLEGIWFCNTSILDKLAFNSKVEDLFSSNKEYLLKITKNDSQEQKDKNSLNFEDCLYSLKIDLVDKSNSSDELANLRPIQTYIVFLDQSETIYFYNFNNIDEKTHIKLDTSKLPRFSTSGKYMNKYVFHFLLESKTKMHLSLFEIQKNAADNFDYTGSWLQFDFLKNIDRNPPSRIEKSWQFILLASIFVISYIFGFIKQNANLNQTLKSNLRSKSAQTRKIQKID